MFVFLSALFHLAFSSAYLRLQLSSSQLFVSDVVPSITFQLQSARAASRKTQRKTFFCKNLAEKQTCFGTSSKRTVLMRGIGAAPTLGRRFARTKRMTAETAIQTCIICFCKPKQRDPAAKTRLLKVAEDKIYKASLSGANKRNGGAFLADNEDECCDGNCGP